MAKNSGLMPMATGGGNLGRRAVAVLVGLVVLSLMVHDPIGAAGAVSGFFGWAGHVIDALATFRHALSIRS